MRGSIDNNLALTPLSSESVEGLIVNNVLNLDEDHEPRRFVFGTSSSGLKTNVELEDDINSELIELSFDWYLLCIQKLAKQRIIPQIWSKQQLECFNKLWEKTVKSFQSKLRFDTKGPINIH